MIRSLFFMISRYSLSETLSSTMIYRHSSDDAIPSYDISTFVFFSSFMLSRHSPDGALSSLCYLDIRQMIHSLLLWHIDGSIRQTIHSRCLSFFIPRHFRQMMHCFIISPRFRRGFDGDTRIRGRRQIIVTSRSLEIDRPIKTLKMLLFKHWRCGFSSIDDAALQTRKKGDRPAPHRK